ncbi:MAG: hypothetical protein ACREP0_03820 [Rhodanobacteraceae bacterium]
MKRFGISLAAAAMVLGVAPLLLPAPARAESLLMKVQQEQRMNLPRNGMTMAQVKGRYGEPLKVLPTRGGSSRYQPPIHRWEYPKYTVYFQNTHVIHSVLRTPGPDSL